MCFPSSPKMQPPVPVSTRFSESVMEAGDAQRLAALRRQQQNQTLFGGSVPANPALKSSANGPLQNPQQLKTLLG